MKYILFVAVLYVVFIWQMSFAKQLEFYSDNHTFVIDSNKFNDYRLDKVNSVRAELWVKSYKSNSSLADVAQMWSDYSSSIGEISHKKFGSKVYYDYKLIQKYVEVQWVQFVDMPWTKIVENIGWWYINCEKTKIQKDEENRILDCTQEIIKATEQTRKFFMNEKGKRYAPHYNSIISKVYSEAGFGISIDPKTKKYYFTAYYSLPVVAPKEIVVKIKRKKFVTNI